MMSRMKFDCVGVAAAGVAAASVAGFDGFMRQKTADSHTIRVQTACLYYAASNDLLVFAAMSAPAEVTLSFASKQPIEQPGNLRL